VHAVNQRHIIVSSGDRHKSDMLYLVLCILPCCIFKNCFKVYRQWISFNTKNNEI